MGGRQRVQKLRLLATTTALAFTTALASCGGGGGGGATPTPSPTTPTPSPTTPTPTPTSGQASTVSGGVRAVQSLALDRDVNASGTTNGANDTPANAQTLINDPNDAPVILKGFVTREATNQPGDTFRTVSDRFDYYRADLRANQVIFLDFRDPALPDSAFNTTNGIDLDLELLEDDGSTRVANSTANTSPYELIIVPEDGEYVIEVEGFRGASTYTLSITDELPTVPVASFNLQATMIAGELSVERTPTSDLGRAIAQTHGQTFGVLNPAEPMIGGHIRQLPVDNYLISAHAQAFGDMRTTAVRHQDPAVETFNTAPDYADKIALTDLVKALNALEGAETFKIRHQKTTAQTLPSSDPVPNPDLQWALYQVDWDDVPTSTFTAQSPALIAVLDSGFFTAHPELAPVLIDERDFATAQSSGQSAEDGFDADAEAEVDPTQPRNPDSPEDSTECFTFHGTHVASTALAPRGNGGIVGVYPGAELMAIRLGREIPPTCRRIFDDTQAIRYAANLSNAAGVFPPRRADVINMSYGGMFFDAATAAAVELAADEGVILIASAGNDGNSVEGLFPSYPAAYPNVVAVGSTNEATIGSGNTIIDAPARSSFSSSYPEVDIAAPGGFSTPNRDRNGDGFVDTTYSATATLNASETGFDADFGFIAGTSFSSPHVAGGAALMKAIAPELTHADFEAFLANGDLTVDAGETGKDNEFGYGVMSLPKMVAAAQTFAATGAAPTPPTTTAFSPRDLTAGQALSSVDIEVRKLGDGALQVTGVAGSDTTIAGQSFVSVFAEDVDGAGFGRYQILIDRGALPSGARTASVTFSFSDGSSRTAEISLTTPSNLTVDTAPVTVQLQRANGGGTSFTTVAETTLANGLSPAPEAFSFQDVDAGSYRLVYGTDLDNDGTLCDAGEVCGVFPSDFSGQSTFSVSSAPVEGLDAPAAYLPRPAGANALD